LDEPVWLSVVIGSNRWKPRRFSEGWVAVSDIFGYLFAPNCDSRRVCGAGLLRACGAGLLDVPLRTDAWLLDVPSVFVKRSRKQPRRFAEMTIAVSDICCFLFALNGDTSTRACDHTDAWPFQGTASDSVGRTVAGHDLLTRLKAEGLVEVRREWARVVLTMEDLRRIGGGCG